MTEWWLLNRMAASIVNAARPAPALGLSDGFYDKP
jgi:hypothetical protein